MIEKREDRMSFEDKIVTWYNKNKREFPWRKTRDPFNLLVAEVLLQRTSAKKVEPIYKKIIARYPTIEILKEANKKDLSEIIRPLGLQNIRSDKLINIARTIATNFNGKVPNDKQSLKEIKGIGDYISSAIICLGFDKPRLMVDSNVERVMGRYVKDEVEYEVSWVKEHIRSNVLERNIRKFIVIDITF